MLKLNTSYSKKVPVQGQEFSSQSFHASMEVELSDGMTTEQIQARIHDTFDLVKQSVESELNGKASTNGNGQQSPPAQTAGNHNGNGAIKASNKQVKFITDLAGQKRITLSELNAEIKQRFGVEGLYDLTSKQASELLDSLKRAKAA